MQKNIDEVLDVVGVLRQVAEMGKKNFAELSYYLMVWGGIIGIASILYYFISHPAVWIIGDCLGFFLVTLGYAGLKASVVVWLPIFIIFGLLIGFSPISVPGVNSMIIGILIGLGFFIAGAIGDKKKSRIDPLGIKYAIIWLTSIVLGFTLAGIYANSVVDWGFIILLMVGLGYIMSGVISTLSVSLIGVVIIVIDVIGKFFVSDYFFIIISILGFFMLATGIIVRKRYAKS